MKRGGGGGGCNGGIGGSTRERRREREVCNGRATMRCDRAAMSCGRPRWSRSDPCTPRVQPRPRMDPVTGQSSSFFSCLESPFPSRRFFSTGEKSGEIAISRLRRMCFLITFRWIGLHFFHFKEQRVCSILYFIFSNNGRISNGDSHPPLDDTYFDLKISIL